jgi:broad specificity phosphatase PhoE
MTTLLLIRHGQTEWDLEGKYTGQVDVPLNETGRTQAERAAATVMRRPVDAIISSDLMRALETATIIAGCGVSVSEPHDNRPPVNVQTDPRLREINQGAWQGMRLDEIKQQFGPEFAAQEANPLDVAAPGGETVREARERVLAAIQEVCQEFPDGRIAIVAHGLSLAIVRMWLLQRPVEDIWSLVPCNAQVISFQLLGSYSL